MSDLLRRLERVSERAILKHIAETLAFLAACVAVATVALVALALWGC